MTAPNPARVRTCYIGLLDDLNSADNVVNEVASCLGMPFRPLGLYMQVTTAITTASATTTFNWRPTPGSATGEKVIATFEIPVASADTSHWFPFNVNDDTSGTSIGTGGEASQYGKDGSRRFDGGIEANMICGPGGELELDAPDGEPGAGAANFWLVYEQLDFADEQQGTFNRVAVTAVNA